jgi:hypothetical protein
MAFRAILKVTKSLGPERAERERKFLDKYLAIAKVKNTKREQTKYQWDKDSRRLKIWEKRHPFGPTTNAEYDELVRITNDLIASYISYYNAHGWMKDEDWIREKLEKARRDWET